MYKQSILREKHAQNTSYWARARKLANHGDPIFGANRRRIAWYKAGSFYITCAGEANKDTVACLSYAYLAITGGVFTHKERRWPGPRAFFVNNSKSYGALGLYFKDDLITPTTIVRITPIELIEDAHDRYTITPPTPQDRRRAPADPSSGWRVRRR